MDIDDLVPGSLQVDAFIADTVEAINGKLYAHGAGWSMLSAPSVPVRHPRIGIGAIIRVPYTATNTEHKVEIRLEDGNGQAVSLAMNQGSAVPGFRTTINVGRPPHLQPGEDQNVPLAVNIDGLIFPRADSYRFVLLINDEVVKSLPLRVSVRQQP